MRKYFGTDGIRGQVGEFPITPDFALRLGYATGRVLIKRGLKPAVVIGKDTRASGYLFESSLEAGLSYAGVDVYMVGPIPTPAIAYLTRTLHLGAGIVISASHNVYTDNGIKFFANSGTKLPDEVELQIEEELDLPLVKAERLGKVRRIADANGRYIEFCKGTFPRDLALSGKTIVLDCANGATYQVAPSVFSELGAKVIKLSCEPDGVNINHECGSTYPASLIEAVRQHKADLGIAFDGDGDRVLFVDKNGVLYNGDKLIYIILKAYLAGGKQITGIVGTVMTNLAMEHKLTSMNIELIRAKVGDRYVLEEMIKYGYTIGGEASGHILCLDKHTTGDGIISALQVLSAILYLNKPLDQLVDWQDYPQTMVNIRLESGMEDWELKSKVIVKDVESKLKGVGRLVLRASGTEPLVRVMVEACDAILANTLANQVADVIKSQNGRIGRD